MACVILYQGVATAYLQTGEAQQITTLEPGQTVKSVINGGKSQAFKISLSSGQYLQLVVEQHGINLSVVLRSPAGITVAELDNPAGGYGQTFISAVIEESGDYTLEARSVEAWANAGEFTLKTESLRAASVEDKNRVEAERVFAAGRALHKEATKESRQGAIKKYEESLSYWKGVDDPHWKALVLFCLGVTYRSLGVLETAERYFKESLAVRLDAPDWRIRASALNDLGLNYQDRQNHQQSLDSLNEALRLYTEHEDRRGQASALNNIGLTYVKSGKMHLAEEYYQRALTLRRAENDKAGEVNILNNIGGYYYILSEPHKALGYFSEALKVLPEIYSPEELKKLNQYATAFNNVALVYDQLGEWQKALESYQKALNIFENNGNDLRRAATLNNIGELYVVLGDPKSAMEYYDKARLLLKKVRAPSLEANVLSHIGQLYLSQDKPAEALLYFEQALEKESNPRERAQALTNIGVVNAQQGKLEKALKVYEEAQSLRRDAGDRRGEAITLQKMGEAYAELGKAAEALANFNEAISRWKAVADRRGEAMTLYSIARLKRDRGQLTEALEQSEAAIEIIESLRTKVNSQRLRTSYFATQQNYYELSIDLRLRLYKLDRSPKHLEAALQASERSRARSLIDTLTEAHADMAREVDQQLLAREREVQQKLNVKAQAQMEVLNKKPPDEQAAAAIAKEIDTLIAQYDSLQAQLRASIPGYADLSQPRPLSLQEIQGLLDDDTLLLEYSLGDEKSYLWLVSNKSIAGSDSLPRRSQIEGATRQLYELLTAQEPRANDDVQERKRRIAVASEQYPAQASSLNRVLLGPVLGELGKKRLIIVADGALQYLPFGALPVLEATGRSAVEGEGGKTPFTRYLIEDHEIVSLPSASAFALMRSELKGRKRAPKDVAVLADPIFDKDDERLRTARNNQSSSSKSNATAYNSQVRGLTDYAILRSGLNLQYLPSTKQEAQAIKDAAPAGRALIALGYDASRAQVLKLQDGRYRIVHFATHGILNDEHPELSGIVLSMFDVNGREQDGILRLHDIYNLRLPVELVVLSACSTGLGRIIKGEGLIGLTRGFMYAGALRIIASLWRVDDFATAQLMKKFYPHVLKEGMTPAAALRQAQIEMLRSQRWQSPFYWAGFVLQGEWR